MYKSKHFNSRDFKNSPLVDFTRNPFVLLLFSSIILHQRKEIKVDDILISNGLTMWGCGGGGEGITQWKVKDEILELVNLDYSVKISDH